MLGMGHTGAIEELHLGSNSLWYLGAVQDQCGRCHGL